jgi:predicted Zn-dependent protease
MAQRLLLGALALLIVAWLAVALRDARLHQDARDELQRAQEIGNRELASVGSKLDRARLLNPDRSLLLDRGIQLYAQGRRAEGIERFRELARAEPENAAAWSVLARVAPRTDPQLAALARARIRELDPRAAR